MNEHPDVFWGLIASFWIGNILLVILNVPLIGIWVKLARDPFRYLYPCALFFICVGVYSTNNEMFGVLQTLVIGVVGYGLLRLGFHPAPVLLGFVLGPPPGGELPPRAAAVARRPRDLHRQPDQRHLRRAGGAARGDASLPRLPRPAAPDGSHGARVGRHPPAGGHDRAGHRPRGPVTRPPPEDAATG